MIGFLLILNLIGFAFASTYPPIVKIHPPITHWAVALPSILLLTEIYLMLRRREEKEIPLVMSFLTMIAIALSVGTGYVAYEAVEAYPIEKVVENLLYLHKYFGFAMLGLAVLVFGLRLFLYFRTNPAVRVIYLILCVILFFGVLYQGSLGGKLVYEHSLGVPAK
ncbi:DUF2231 domain-containing protein [Thermocrinis sp.]